jgi:hypothetical protein
MENLKQVQVDKIYLPNSYASEREDVRRGGQMDEVF